MAEEQNVDNKATESEEIGTESTADGEEIIEAESTGTAESTVDVGVEPEAHGIEKILIIGEDGQNGILKTQLFTALAEEFGINSISEVRYTT